MDAATAEKAVTAIARLREHCQAMNAIKTSVQADMNLFVPSWTDPGYTKTLKASSQNAFTIVQEYFKQNRQRMINEAAREVRSCGVSIPDDCLPYVTDYPIVPGAISHVNGRN